MDTVRRRSPWWVRQCSDREVHSIAMALRRGQTQADLTDAQEWLWRGLISELEYRRRRARPAWRGCSCELCIPPFE